MLGAREGSLLVGIFFKRTVQQQQAAQKESAQNPFCQSFEKGLKDTRGKFRKGVEGHKG